MAKKKNKQRYYEEALMCEKMHTDAKEAYKRLRTNVIYTLVEEKCKKLAITSPNVGEGKSTLAVNLAYTLSTNNSKVLLIELDLRLPTISQKLNIKYENGLVDYLAGKVSEKEIVYQTNYSNFDVIFSGPVPPIPTELISSNKLKMFVEKLESYYDYIIFDLPPVNIVSDALAATKIVDGYILAIRENYTDRRSLVDCVRQLDFINAPILGFVLTDSKYKEGSYYKHYYNRYGKRYYGRYGYGGYYGRGYYGHYGHSGDHDRDDSRDHRRDD